MCTYNTYVCTICECDIRTHATVCRSESGTFKVFLTMNCLFRMVSLSPRQHAILSSWTPRGKGRLGSKTEKRTMNYRSTLYTISPNTHTHIHMCSNINIKCVHLKCFSPKVPFPMCVNLKWDFYCSGDVSQPQVLQDSFGGQPVPRETYVD